MPASLHTLCLSWFILAVCSQVRRTAEGDIPVPLTVAYNHHFESTMTGGLRCAGRQIHPLVYFSQIGDGTSQVIGRGQDDDVEPPGPHPT